MMMLVNDHCHDHCHGYPLLSSLTSLCKFVGIKLTMIESPYTTVIIIIVVVINFISIAIAITVTIIIIVKDSCNNNLTQEQIKRYHSQDWLADSLYRSNLCQISRLSQPPQPRNAATQATQKQQSNQLSVNRLALILVSWLIPLHKRAREKDREAGRQTEHRATER